MIRQYRIQETIDGVGVVNRDFWTRKWTLNVDPKCCTQYYRTVQNNTAPLSQNTKWGSQVTKHRIVRLRRLAMVNICNWSFKTTSSKLEHKRARSCCWIHDTVWRTSYCTVKINYSNFDKKFWNSSKTTAIYAIFISWHSPLVLWRLNSDRLYFYCQWVSLKISFSLTHVKVSFEKEISSIQLFILPHVREI